MVLGLVLVCVVRLQVDGGLVWGVSFVQDRVVLFREDLALQGSLHVGPVGGVALNQTLQVF